MDINSLTKDYDQVLVDRREGVFVRLSSINILDTPTSLNQSHQSDGSYYGIE
jgi:hypothetical protein